VAIRSEIKVIDEVMLRKQVLKVETVDVTVDRTNFVLYLVYLYNPGPRRSYISGDLPYARPPVSDQSFPLVDRMTLSLPT
jgi:hypothetical protein